MANLENEYPGFAEVFLNEADWSSVVPAVRLSSGERQDDDRANVALFGGAYASQPLGREMLIRLARYAVILVLIWLFLQVIPSYEVPNRVQTTWLLQIKLGISFSACMNIH